MFGLFNWLEKNIELIFLKIIDRKFKILLEDQSNKKIFNQEHLVHFVNNQFLNSKQIAQNV